jgi:hypothetical protein
MITVDDILARHQENLNKALVSAYDYSNAGLNYLPWQDAVAVWGGVETPLLSRVGSTRALEITHKWKDAQVPSPAANAQLEGVLAADLNGEAVIPVKRTNTCQLAAKLLTVTGSALQESQNGVYGSELRDQLDEQLSLLLPQMVASIALDAWTSTEVTQANATEASARKMAGLVGTVGAGGFDDGLITAAHGSTVTSNSGADADESVIGDWLEAIVAAGAGANHRPTAVYTSLKGVRLFSTFANIVEVNVNVNDDAALASLTAGKVVAKYIAPWRGVLDIVYEPQNAHSVTAANNWMAALCEPDIKIANFRGDASEQGIEIVPLAKLGDREDRMLVWEGTVEAKVYAAHGIFHNFTVDLTAGS